MRICFSSPHRYPGRLHGVSSASVHDNLVLGLAEAGHEIYYHLGQPPEVALPAGVEYTPSIRHDVDILHVTSPQPPGGLEWLPWVKTVHCDIRSIGLDLRAARKNWIYVSRTQARLHGSERFVYNGINPGEFDYSESKAAYLVFMVGGLHRAMEKGLDIAVSVCRQTGMELRVAATGGNPVESEAFAHHCRKLGAVPVGAVHGRQKAELLAGAKALLFPSRLNEAFGLVIAEALMSGTPVIASASGAIPEILRPTTGFVCHQEEDYVRAIENCHRINPRDCRMDAMERFTHHQMARGYLAEYQREIENTVRLPFDQARLAAITNRLLQFARIKVNRSV